MQYYYLSLILLFLLISITGGEFLIRKKAADGELLRKLIHILSGVLAVASVLLIKNYLLVVITGSVITILSFPAISFNLLKGINSRGRKSWGIFYFPLSFTICYSVLYPDHIYTLLTVLLIFTFADSFAAIGGRFVPAGAYNLTSDVKTAAGSWIFFIYTFLIIFFSEALIPNVQNKNYEYLLQASFTIAFILTLTEALSSKGSDNLTIPLIGSILVLAVLENPDAYLLFMLSNGIVLGTLIAVLSIKLRFLTSNGAAATLLLAVFIFGFGGWKWTLPVFMFFVVSSLLSHLRSSKNKKVDLLFEKSGARDYLQVFSNGGIGSILAVINYFYPSEILYIMYSASVAGVCADTWGTEIGTMFRAATYNILNMKKVNQGTSGGVSVAGTLGSVAGACFIAFISVFWINTDYITYLLIIVFSGTAAALVDSISGAAFQGSYKCNVCGAVTEKRIHCSEHTVLIKGFGWLNNDLVNVAAALSGGFFSVIFLYIFL